MIKSVGLSGKTNTALAIGIVTLLIGATSIFVEIQDSVNLIWRVKAKPKRGWLKLLKDRLLSSSLVVSLGFLLMVSLLINGLILALSDRLTRLMPGLGVYIISAVNFLISTAVVTVLFRHYFQSTSRCQNRLERCSARGHLHRVALHAGPVFNWLIHRDYGHRIDLWSGWLAHRYSDLDLLHSRHFVFRSQSLRRPTPTSLAYASNLPTMPCMWSKPSGKETWR